MLTALGVLLLAAACRSDPPPSSSPLDPEGAPIGRFDHAAVEAEVQALLAAQVEAWNRGDLEGFMAGYWRSPELRFASGGDVQRGFEETLERYRRRYPDRAAMGTLFFEEIDVRVLSADHALAFGRWRLIREADEPSGLFTLLLERGPEGEWRIVHDHTSSAQP